MSSNSTRTEKIVINAVNDAFLASEDINPEISSNDKTLSWDGTVYIYNDGKQRKEDFVARCPVQVKGRTVSFKEFNKFSIKFRVDKEALRHYLVDGGVVYIVGYIHNGEVHLYWCDLLPYDIRRAYETQGDDKKEYFIHLRQMSNDGNKLKKWLISFYDNKKKQGSLIDRSHTNDLFSLNEKNITRLSLSNFDGDILSLLDNEPRYIYTRDGNYGWDTIGKITIESLATTVAEGINKIDGQAYFTEKDAVKVERFITTENGKNESICIYDCIKFHRVYPLNTVTFEYNQRGSFKQIYESLLFIKDLINQKPFLIGKEKIEVTNVNLSSLFDDIDTLIKQTAEILELLKHLDIDLNVKIEDFTGFEIDLLLQLYKSCILKEWLDFNIEAKQPVEAKCYKIGPLNILLIMEYKDGKERFSNYFDYPIKIDYNASEISGYLGLKKEDFARVSNIKYSKLIEDIFDRDEISDEYLSLINWLALEMIAAYDETNNKKILEAVIFIYNKACECTAEISYFINKLQAKARLNQLTQEDKNKLIQIRDKCDDILPKLHISILLDDFVSYTSYKNQISDEEFDNIKSLVIYNYMPSSWK